MTLTAFLSTARAEHDHAVEHFDDDALEAFLLRHVRRLRKPPRCETIADALALVEELERIDTASDIAADRGVLLAALKAYLRKLG